jgi:phosphate transport system protein
MEQQHTVKAFDDDLNRLRGLISEMGARAEHAVMRAIAALETGDHAAAQAVVAEDRILDDLEAEVERMVVQTIALRAPMADDLRAMIAALKIAAELERVGDYGKSIAKRVPIMTSRTIQSTPLLKSMAALATEILRDVMKSYAGQDAALALSAAARDKGVDDFYNSVFRTLISHMLENPQLITESAHLLFIAKNIERIGDHATNVAEMVYYAATGERMEEREKGADPIDGAGTSS